MTKRYLGNIITQNPTAPAGPYESDAAPGVWSLAEALAYQKAGLWPIPGNSATIAFSSGGSTGSRTATIEKIIIETTGNSTDYGDLSIARNALGALSSSTRSVHAGGKADTGGGSTDRNEIDYIAFAGGGTASDFGDLTVAREEPAGTSNETRGLFAGGNVGGTQQNVIDYITIASTGNASDFGDLTRIVRRAGAAASSTRAVFAGGLSQNVIDYVTIGSTGNATDFGDMTTSGSLQGGGASSGTRAVFMGVNGGNTMEYITIASTGNSTDFGDLVVGRRGSNTSSLVRGVMMGGGGTNHIDYITIATIGNASDFGDLLTGVSENDNCSSGHGGLAA
jgi:hypothetical protein